LGSERAEDINAAGGVKALGGARLRVAYGDIKSDPTVLG